MNSRKPCAHLKSMYTLNFLLKDLVHKTVLLHHRDPFKRHARDGNSVECPTPPCATIELPRTVSVGTERRTRDVLYEQLGWLETF